MQEVSIHMIMDFPSEHGTAKNTLTHDEQKLLYLFRSLPPEQQEVYLEQGMAFVSHRSKKTVIPFNRKD